MSITTPSAFGSSSPKVTKTLEHFLILVSCISFSLSYIDILQDKTLEVNNKIKDSSVALSR
jgi:hypothetical protein